MKYFTKEWYELSQKTDYHLTLEEDPRCAEFSEEFYEDIYEKKLEEFLLMEREIFNLPSLSYEFDKELSISDSEYDEEELTELFSEIHRENVEKLRESLPEDILSGVADIRVLELDHATAENIEKIREFCEDNERACERASMEYDKSYNQIKGKLPQKLRDRFILNDCVVTDSKVEGNDLILNLDSRGGLDDKVITGARFKNYEIIERERELENLWWLFDELYIADGKYELHVLFNSNDDDDEYDRCYGLIVRADDIDIIYG